jgi:hypothetical protein
MKQHTITRTQLRKFQQGANLNHHEDTFQKVLDHVRQQDPLAEVLTLSDEIIKEAYGKVCDEWKEKIRKAFPEFMKNEEYFAFGSSHIFDTELGGRPLYIGVNHAPKGMEEKTLCVNPMFEMEVFTLNGIQQIKFKRKEGR